MPSHHLTQDLPSLNSPFRRRSRLPRHHPAGRPVGQPRPPQCGIPSSQAGWRGRACKRRLDPSHRCHNNGGLRIVQELLLKRRLALNHSPVLPPSSQFSSVCPPVPVFFFFLSSLDAVAGIIWLMTAEFPYLITNRIWAPLELLGEESDEWQGRAQWPERGLRAKTAQSVKQAGKTGKRKGWEMVKG